MKTKLDEIILKTDKVFFQDSPTTNGTAIEIDDVKQVALEFAKHILEEAAKNAEIHYPASNNLNASVNKQSITNTLNKYL